VGIENGTKPLPVSYQGSSLIQIKMKIYEQRLHDHRFQGQSFPLEVRNVKKSYISVEEIHKQMRVFWCFINRRLTM
jgi:hypothetical protein